MPANDYEEENAWRMNISKLFHGNFAAAAVLISLGAVLGKISNFQLLMMGLIEVAFWVLNEKIGVVQFKAVDAGMSVYVHTFGAVFGLGAAFMLKAKNSIDTEIINDILAMLGTIVIWVIYPVWNSAFAGSSLVVHRSVINTILSLAGSALGAFAFSQLFRKTSKTDMGDI